MSTTPTLLSQECADFATSLRSAFQVAKLQGKTPESFLRAADLLERASAALTQGAGEAVEPVAWVWEYANGEEEVVFVDLAKCGLDPTECDVPSKVTPLYAAPPAEHLLQAVARASQFEGQRDQLQKEFFTQAAQIGLMEAEIASLRAALSHERNTGGRDE